jgi:para-nitrobenzyl esterase
MIVRRHVTAAALALGVSVLPLAAFAQAPAPTATIKQGPLTGAVVEGVEEFWGIPYAAPPVGDLRWKPPTAPARWTAARDASKAGATCQPTQKGEYTEDCLFANVTRPAGAKPGQKLPV